MPWASNEELPDAVRGVLPSKAQSQFRQVANAVLSGGGTDTAAMRQAWAVVGRKWRKGSKGLWVRKARKSLYVNRPVLNAQDIIAWAKEQGFQTTLLPDDLHVTIAYSREPFEWKDAEREAPEEVIVKGGRRSLKRYGKDGEATVLSFQSKALQERWKALQDSGASWDWDGYRPHITLSYKAGDLDLKEIEPYDGEIKLGPEVWEEVTEGWADDITEKTKMPKRRPAKKSPDEDELDFDESEVKEEEDDLEEDSPPPKTKKRGARHTQQEYSWLQDIHDKAVSLGASCEGLDSHDMTRREDMLAAAKVFKVDDNLGLVFGWAIICKVKGEDYYDTQGDHIPEKAMLKASADFMQSDRVMKIMHDGDAVGKIVFAWPMTTDIAKAMGLKTGTTGLMIAAKPDNAEVLEKFRKGDYTGFSIGGTRVKDVEVD